MKSEVKEQWVAALRSGKYKQTRNCLRDTDGFCCLGVLCDLHARETNNEWVPTIGGGSSYLERRVVLPLEVMVWAGLPDNDPCAGDDYNNETLGGINDMGVTFNKIADLIEREL